jgi:hypothetical protein
LILASRRHRRPFSECAPLFAMRRTSWCAAFKSAGREAWFAWYVAGMVAIGLAAALIMPDTRKYGYLDGSGQVER